MALPYRRNPRKARLRIRRDAGFRICRMGGMVQYQAQGRRRSTEESRTKGKKGAEVTASLLFTRG